MAAPTAPNRSAGYTFLIESHGLEVVPNWHTSSVGPTGTTRSIVQGGRISTVYPAAYWPGDTTGDHLEFALKYDGVNLGILSALFDVIAEAELIAWIASKPTSKYARRIWFLYEFLKERTLPLPALDKGNYIELLERDRYFTTVPGRRVRRQRVIDNLLGGPSFCPVVRRTPVLDAMDETELRQRCERIVAAYPPEVVRRALGYLYLKETKSSYEIEHAKPSATRTERFIGLLEMAASRDFCNKPSLIEVQNRVVDPRFCDHDYRADQNYVGQTVSFQKQLIHYVCPKPEDIPSLMEGLIRAHGMMQDGHVPAIVHAAAVSYGFVFMHPFSDGNGRIHRFLIHNILSLRGLTPTGLMFPVSAAMLKNPQLYDRSLEAFSRGIMELIDYKIDDHGRMRVAGATGDLYRFIDMTAEAEALREFVQLTIEHELLAELAFLTSHDTARRAIQDIVDMPDRQIDLFMQFCLQQNGHLSANKRKKYFPFLKDEELSAMEAALRREFADLQNPAPGAPA